eukprot:gene11002-15378_t
MTMFKLLALSSCCVATTLASSSGVWSVSVTTAGTVRKFALQPRSHSSSSFQDDEAAWGMYNATFNSTGWDRLEVHTNPDIDDDTTAAAAGFFEGQVTALRIEQNAVNSGIPSFKLTPALSEYIASNSQFAMDMSDLATGLPKGHPDRRILYHVALVATQLTGMYEGYLAGRADLEKAGSALTADPLTYMQLQLLNMGGDLEDLDGIGTCNVTAAAAAAAADGSTPSPVFDKGRCSALVRLLDGNSDVLISQDTWSSLNSMLRMYKMVSFSSYPGVLNSGDDFYVISSGMVQWETTIGNSNSKLAKQFISPLSILEWVRNIVANRLADDCLTWVDYYQRWNSGTYNNMNMCFDYKLFKPSSALVNGTFVIAEQIPGKLDKDRYFGSYNTAYDPQIREWSGANVAEQKYGNWFNYAKTARAQIFARDAPAVNDLTTMKKLMRSCEYKTDPLSTQLDTCKYIGWTNCTPAFTAENCIATRGDLNSESGVWGIDAYISQFSTYDAKKVGADVVSGPVGSADNAATPDFVWSSSTFSALPHHGMPDTMVFPWVRFDF